MEKGNRQVVVSTLQFACTDNVPTNLATAESCSLETLSTLKFAQLAKFIKNNAVVNEDASGDVVAMRLQIQQLKELAAAQHELQILHAQIGAVTSEREQQMRSLTDKIAKMEAELQAAEPVKVELQQAHSDAQNLVLSLCYKLDIVIIECSIVFIVLEATLEMKKHQCKKSISIHTVKHLTVAKQTLMV
ncbi:hypothetical protein GOBAR_DD01163 [Gossypium barbadense]|nr:hypothetical protein GOBAR_DD01163 [Gossypium barbadense]